MEVSEKASGPAPAPIEYKVDTDHGLSETPITARDTGNFYVTNTFTGSPHQDGTDHGLSMAPITLHDTGNFYVNNAFTGTPHQDREADFEAMRQIVVQGQAPSQSRSVLQSGHEGPASPRHDNAMRHDISSSATKSSISHLSPPGRTLRDRSSLDLEAGELPINLEPLGGEGGGSGKVNPHSQNPSAVENIGPTSPKKKWKPDLLDGFPKSAAFMVLDEERGSTLFRRFDQPAMRNLLYLQSRVAALTDKLQACDKEDWEDSLRGSRLKALERRITARKDHPPHERPPKPMQGKPQDQSTIGKENGLSRLDEELDSLKTAKPQLEISQRLADLEACVQNADTPLINLVDVDSPIPGNYRKGKEHQEEKTSVMQNRLEVRSQERIRMRISRLLDYISLTLKFSREELLLYLLDLSGADRALIGMKMEELLCILSDELPLQINNIITGLEVLLQHYLRNYLNENIVAPSLAAQSWEDFEIFSSAEKMRKRRREWEGLHPDKHWPFLGLSDAWIRKMQNRWDLAQDLKEALKEYHEALLLQHELFALPRPAERTRKTVRKWYLSSFGHTAQFSGSSKIPLLRDDVITLRAPGDEDRVSKFLSRKLPFFFLHEGISASDIQFTSERKVGRVVTGINMIAAISILVVAVWVLSVVSHYREDTGVGASKKELGTLTGFIVGFALWVGFMTTLPRKEMFGAIAVYAAVLVVFVGTG